MSELGWKLSPIKRKTKTAQITTQCDEEKYIDDDLFGYMDTETDKKRIAPVKTNGMISIFPYKGDIDRGVRFDPEGKEHSMFDLEITTNVFRSNWAIELDRVGVIESENKELPADEKNKRVKALLTAILNLWSRVKQTNYLTKMSPDILVLVFRDDKTLTVGDKLRIDESYNLDIDALKEVLDYHKDGIKEVYIAGFGSFLNNWDELVKELNGYLDGKVKVMKLTEFKNLVLSEDFKFF